MFRKVASMIGKTPKLSAPPTAIRTPASTRTSRPYRSSKKLRNRDQLQFPASPDDEPCAPDHDVHGGRDQAGQEGREAVQDPHFGVIHVSDDADLGGNQRDHSDVQSHAARRDQEIGAALDVPPVRRRQRKDWRPGRRPGWSNQETRSSKSHLTIICFSALSVLLFSFGEVPRINESSPATMSVRTE